MQSPSDVATNEHAGSVVWRPRAVSLYSILTIALLLAVAVFYVLSATVEIINFSWPQPMLDQYKLYGDYLLRPFPENVMQLTNGHRPILPNLIRVAEIRWFSGNQELQKWVSLACALMTAVVITAAAWREPSMSKQVRAACTTVTCVAVFWLANGRMLLHPNEALHVYMLSLSVIFGACAVNKSVTGYAIIWMSVATVCAIAATFCFGSGIASFPALAIVAWLSRVPLRGQAVLLTGFLVTLIIYLGALPSDEGVRGMIELRPLQSFVVAERWLASPWINAWFGFADSSFEPWMTAHGTWAAALLIQLGGYAASAEKVLHIKWNHGGALAFGILGCLALAIALIRRLPRRQSLSTIETIAIVVALFGGATAVLIGLSRLDYLTLMPAQTFASRYLPWSCLFWLGLILLTLLKTDRRGGVPRLATLGLVIIGGLLILPTHARWALWGEASYRASQRSAAAARSNVFDASIFPDGDAVSSADVLRTLVLLRERNLAMYANREHELLGQSVKVADSSERATIAFEGIEHLTDPRDGTQAVCFSGKVINGIGWVGEAGALSVLDENNRVVGFAERSFVGDSRTSYRFNVPKKRGFDGYIRHYDASKTYRLAVLDPKTAVAGTLSLIPNLAP